MISKVSLPFIVLCSLSTFASYEHNGEFSIERKESDSTEFNESVRLQTNNKYSFNGTKDDFGLTVIPSDYISVDATFSYDANSSASDKSNIDEAKALYKKYLSASQSIAIGDNIIVWGRNEEINPVDVWNSEDYSEFLVVDKAERKLVRTMAIYELSTEKNKFEAIIALNDIRSKDKFAETGDPLCNRHCQKFSKENIISGYKSLGITTEFEDFETSGVDIGFRFTSQVNQTNISFMYYHGAEHFPLHTRRFESATHVIFTPYNETSTSVGLDLSSSVGPFVLFMEAKYQMEKPFLLNPSYTKYSDDDDGLEFSDEYSWILGIEKSYSYETIVNIQYFQKKRMLKLEGVYDFGGNELVTLALKNSYLENIVLDINYVLDYETQDSSKTFELTYSLNDKFKILAGITNYHSKHNHSLFSGLHHKETSYCTVKYTF